MPKRVLDFDAMWASDKIAACAEWAQVEYAWLYGLADCAGCFELSNMRVIWGRVAAIRHNFSIERLEQVFDEFQDKGLLFVWCDSGKRYGYWTGSDVPGRLPPPSWRNRLERLAPEVPREELAKYLASHSVGVRHKKQRRDGALNASSDASVTHELDTQPPVAIVTGVACAEKSEPRGLWSEPARQPHLTACLEATQAQDLGLDLEGNQEREVHTHVRADAKSVCEASPDNFQEKQDIPAEKAKTTAHSESNSQGTRQSPVEENKTRFRNAIGTTQPEHATATTKPNAITKPVASTQIAESPEAMRDIWQQARGALTEVRALSPERTTRCRERLSNARSRHGNVAQFLTDFRQAVARAAATPFLCGAGPGGWCANFDWLIANDTNYLKILEGRYDSGPGISGGGERNATAGATGGAGGSWASHVIAREQAVRRELNAGAGPSVATSATRVRSGVINRVLNRL
jgi:hypothetical protein